MSDTVVELSKRRPPVHYTIRISHHWDETIEVFVEDISDDDRSRASAIWALKEAAKMFPDSRP